MTESQKFNAFELTIMENIVVMSMIFTLLVESELYLLALPIFQRYYIALGKSKTINTVPLAFTIADNLDPVSVDGFTLSWTKEALANFAQIYDEVKKIKNLPYAFLRGLLEFKLSNVSRIEPSMGLDYYKISQRQQKPFAYIHGKEQKKIEKALKTILHDWIETDLAPYGKREDVSENAIERLRKLRKENKLLLIRPFTSQIFPWGWNKDSGTTSPPDKYHSFPQFADYIARLVSGNKIFQGLGNVKRIITNQGGMNSVIVELLTDPIGLDDNGLFSLRIVFELVTYPSVHQPLLTMDVTKRRWLSSLKGDGFSPNGINGYIFSRKYSDRVFNFKLNRRKNKDTDKWEWQPDSSFSVLQRELNLPLDKFNGVQIANGESSTDDCQVLLTYSDSDGNQSHDIKAGIPEKDKLEAFQAIKEIFKPLKITPFNAYTPVKVSHPTKDKKDIDAATKQINKPTLLNAVMELLDNPKISEFTPKYLSQQSDNEINQLLYEHFRFTLSEQGIKLFRFNGNNKDQSTELNQLIKLNKEAIERLYPDKKPLVVIFHENENNYSRKLLQTIIQILWGDTIEIQTIKIPKNTHGAKKDLPHKELKNKERSQKRVEAWTPLAKKLAQINRPKFCLVMARKFYPNPENEGKFFKDDKVNKPSTYKALASIGRSCVQFIIPPDTDKDSGDVNISDFIYPAQSSIKELLWAHSGRIDDIQKKVERHFNNIKLEHRPKEIITITVVRKNAGRKRGWLDNTFLPIAIRTDVANGLSEMKYCYEDSETRELMITDWKPFNDALYDISKISPVSLGKDKNNKNLKKERFQTFVDKVISNSVKEKKNPIVEIDSSNCVQLWGWLSDRKINLSDISLDEIGRTYMQDEWKGARIVRIRQDLAPGIVEDKVKYLAETFLADTRTLEQLKADKSKQIKIPAPSSPTGLLRLNVNNNTGCVPYLSIGKKTVHTNHRGASCYRSVEQDKLLKVKVKYTDKNNKDKYTGQCEVLVR